MCSATFFPPPLLLLLLPLSIRQYVSHSLTHSLCQTLRIRNVTKYHCRCCCYSYGMCLVYFIYYFTHSLGAKRDFMYRTTFYGNLLCIFCPVVCEARTMYRICVNNGNFSGFFFGQYLAFWGMTIMSVWSSMTKLKPKLNICIYLIKIHWDI